MERTRFVVGAALVAVGLVAAALDVGLRDATSVIVTSDAEGARAPAAGPPLAGAVRFADAHGDATDVGVGEGPRLAACSLLQTNGPCPELPPAGTPAPHFDILEFGLESETPTEIVLSMTVAKLSRGMPELADPDGFHRMVWYSMCWGAEPDRGCSRYASLDVMAHGGGVHMQPTLQIYTKGCNEWYWCAYAVPVDVQYGAPATVRFTVPKALATADGAYLGLHGLEASTGWIGDLDAFPMWHAGITADTPAYRFHTHVGTFVGYHVADGTAAEDPGVALTPFPGFPAHALDAPLLEGAPGATHASGSKYDVPDMDLLAFDLHEDGEDLVVEFTVAALPQEPTHEFDYASAIGLNGRVFEVGYLREGGESYGYAGRCIMTGCQGAETMTPEVTLGNGSPGLISVRVPLAFLGDPMPGDRTSLLSAVTMYMDGSVYWNHHDDPENGEVHSVFMVDSLLGGAPYEFGAGHQAPFPPVGAAMAGHGHH